MSAMERLCERAMALQFRRVQGFVLEPRDERWLAEHRDMCPDCAAESQALALIEEDGSASPAEPLDDIARRRFIDDVLRKAETVERTTREQEASDGMRFSKIARLAVAAAAAAVFVVAATFWLPGSLSDAVVSHKAPAAQSAESSSTSLPDLSVPRFLVLSGDVRIEGRPAAVGGALKNGQRIETQGGSAVVAMSDGIFVDLRPSTRLSIDRPMSDAIEIVLEAGAVLSSVDPSRKAPMLSVVTPHGRVTVTGTIFGVEVGDDDSFVRVARGKVEIDSVASVAAVLPAGSGKAMVSGVVRDLSAEERQGMIRRDDLFSLLDTEAKGAVDISSVPLGAEVLVDGSSVGTTPLVVSLRAGHRDLSLSVDGEPIVRELMDIEVGSRFERVFDLSAGDTADVASEARETQRRVAPVVAPSVASSRKTFVSPTAEQLLYEAQSLRAAGQYRASAQVYRRIVERHTAEEAATSALVSLGTIELEKLSESSAALSRFELYLSRTGRRGPLAQEALYGRARALRALGRVGEERAALEELVESYGRSLYSKAARARLVELNAESK
ncbi:MAG: FecR domain-containing protein [Myxococcota bacterium]|jgi:ferric-dicitrate binding protein FerR (iron transport regulator)|nr:FecR domain-containing protein [Myxococcota bacterium]